MNVLVMLLVAALSVSILLGTLARLPAKQLVAQTLAMLTGVVLFYGLVSLL